MDTLFLWMLGASICSGLAVGLFVLWVSPFRTPTRLHARSAPYTQVACNKLGVLPRNPSAVVFLPPLSLPMRLVGRICYPLFGRVPFLADQFGIGQKGEENVALRLRQAGKNPDLDQYRATQMQWSVVLAGIFGIIVYVGTAGSLFLALLFAALGFILVASSQSARLDTAIARRSVRMVRELPPTLTAIATRAFAGQTLNVAIADITRDGEGVFLHELRAVLATTRREGDFPDAFGLAREQAADPTVQRVFSLFGTAARYGATDFGQKLIELVQELDTRRARAARDEATRRRLGMAVITIVFMAPVVVLMLAAPTFSLFYS